jgi:hypothetical protein
MTVGQIINIDGQVTTVEFSEQPGKICVSNLALERATGWSLKPEGLCRDQVCVPVLNITALSQADQVNLSEFARLVQQNIVIDAQRKVVALGEQAQIRGTEMATLEAPDFTLPDIHGRQVSFSDYNRRKRLLLAWSSW